LIRKAIRRWEAETCIRFDQVNDVTNQKINYLRFVKNAGCFSAVGFAPSTQGYQDISLGDGCMNVSFFTFASAMKQGDDEVDFLVFVFQNGVILHEIGHALGFFHEHSRPDRDDHVSIVSSNIVKSNEFNFEKFSADLIDLAGMPYDYASNMHYGSTVCTSLLRDSD
jgi:hypothetical protein